MALWKYLIVLSLLITMLFGTACEELGQVPDEKTTDKSTVQETPAEAPTDPYIDHLYPESGAPGIEVTIQGKNFDKIEEVVYRRWVHFDGKDAKIVSWSAQEIVVEVPLLSCVDPQAGPVNVTVGSYLDQRSNSKPFTYKAPRIDNISPSFAKPGAEVTIQGADFGVKGTSSCYWLKFGASHVYVQAENWRDTEIIVTAPTDYGTGIGDAQIVQRLLSLATGGWTGSPPIEEVLDMLADFLGIDIASIQLNESDPWWVALTKIMVAIGVPSVEVYPDGSMDVAVIVRTPAGENEAALFTYELPQPQVIPSKEHPEVIGVDPAQPMVQPMRQWLTILGNGFVPDTKVTLRVNDSQYLVPADRTEFVSAVEIRVYVGLTDFGTWTVQIINPEDLGSNAFSFEVMATSLTSNASVRPLVCDNSAQPIPMLDAAHYALAAGFEDEAAVTVLAIAWAESSGIPTACWGNKQDGIIWSWDRGILQINNYHHPLITDDCAFDPACAFQAAFKISSSGTDFTPWTTYRTGDYQNYLKLAKEAVEQILSQKTLSPTITFSPSNFGFTTTQGGLNPPNQTLRVWNSGGGTLDWLVTDDTAWLTLSATSGTSTGEMDNIILMVNTSGMTAGDYGATITITAPGSANSPQILLVNLSIIAQQTGSIEVTSTPSGASFSLSGPASYSGYTPWSKTSAPVGTYTITWGPMSSYTPPPSETQTLSPGGSISFSGVYQTIQQEPSIPSLLNVGISSETESWPPRGFLQAKPGDMINTWYDISYSGTRITVKLRTTIFDPSGREIGNPLGDPSLVIMEDTPEHTGWVGVTFEIPTEAILGTYDVRFAVYTEDGTDEYDVAVKTGWLKLATEQEAETITVPSTPTGPSIGEVNQSLSYSTEGATSNLGHNLEYRFDWGDGSYSSWSSSTSTGHSWSSEGTYTVRAQARCAAHTSVVSEWSSGLSVNIEPVSSVSARIDSYSPSSPVDVTVGSSTTISVTFTNTGNTAWSFVAGATVWDSNGNQVANYSQTLSAPLQPQQHITVSWTHPVNQGGDYWLQFGVWKATPFTAENLLDKEPSPSQKLIIGQEPSSIDARIDSYSPSSTVDVTVGEPVTISVTFTNTGNTPWRFIAGASVWDANGNIVADYERTLSTELQPGQQKTVTWSHGVNQAGDYWLQFGIWKAKPYISENLLDKKPSPSQRLIVGHESAKFSAGEKVRTTTNLNVRTGPGTDYPEITDPDYPDYAPADSTGLVLSGPVSADGYVWWQIQYDAGYTGWSAENWLETA